MSFIQLLRSFYSPFLSLDDEIRQNEGFKNVSLGNVLSAAYRDKRVSFISLEDQVIFR